MSKTSLRDKIKAADDLKSELVEVPEWGCIIEVRTLTGAARAQLFGEDVMDAEGNVIRDKAYIKVLIGSCFDPKTGEALFTAEDAEWLSGKSSLATERLAQVATRLSGIGAGALGEAEKNSGAAAANSDSTSG